MVDLKMACLGNELTKIDPGPSASANFDAVRLEAGENRPDAGDPVVVDARLIE